MGLEISDFRFTGFYFTGDGALRDKDGDYRITGRMDDVINVSGKRLGTAEIEDAMVTSDCFCWFRAFQHSPNNC